eukprot:gene4797-8383_t
MSNSFKEPKRRKLNEEETSINEINILKKNILSFEKAINNNLILRMKHKNEPEKFMESEIELDEEIKKFQVLATQPDLYKHFIKYEGLNSLLSLLTHENSDIWLEVIEVLREMTDPTTILENEESIILIDELMKENILDRILKLLLCLNETKKDESEGIHGCFEILENLSEIKPEIICLSKNDNLLDVLLKKVLNEKYNDLKLYASELLSIFTSLSIIPNTSDDNFVKDLNEFKLLFLKDDNLEMLLKSLNFYKKNKPEISEEKEIFKNLFNSLCSLLLNFEISEKFRKIEGIEFLISFIKNKKYSRNSSMKALNFCLSNNEKNIKRFVEQDGIKIIFPLFLKQKIETEAGFESLTNTNQLNNNNTCIEHILNCLVLISKYLDSFRFFNKFKENEFEKLDHLFDFFLFYRNQLLNFDKSLKLGYLNQIYENVDDDLIFYERLNSGGLSIYILIFNLFSIISSDEEIKNRIKLLLKQRALNELDVLNLMFQNKDDKYILEYNDIINSFKSNFNLE